MAAAAGSAERGVYLGQDLMWKCHNKTGINQTSHSLCTISTKDEDVALYFLKSILKSVEQIKETDEDTETVENAENTEQDIQQTTTEIAEMSLAEKYSQLQQQSSSAG